MYTRLPESGDATLVSLLLDNGVVVKTLPGIQLPAWFGFLWKSAMLLLFALMLLSILNSRKTAHTTGFVHDRETRLGKSHLRSVESVKEKKKPRRTPGKASGSLEPAVTFADVAGIDEVRAELEEIVQFLRSPEHFQRLGARIPRGALLVGPPGTGKTLLAKAVAGEAGVPFFTMSASEFVEMYVGLGASRVRTLFKQARESAPCVIFIDELDAAGRKRSMNMMGNDERDQTLNQLLVELDGFASHKAVVVLAATNRADILDKALLRPGRFDRHIALSLPDRVGREAILRVYTRRTPVHKDVSLERVARLTTGMSGADLANLVNEAALLAARQNMEQLTHTCFEEALVRIQLGAIRPLVMSEADRRTIAFHEGGHALVAYHLPLADTVNRVTILPRGKTLGVTQFTAEEDRYNYSRETLMARIAVALGGRVAEELAFGPERVTTGAENDLQVVTDLARRMVTRWGMSQQVGVVFADYRPGEMSLNMRRSDSGTVQAQARSLVADTAGLLLLNGKSMAEHRYGSAMSMPAAGNGSIAMATLIDYEMQRILNEGYVIAHAVLSEHYDQLMRLANALMEYEQLDRSQFEALLEKAC
jgi:cell division protease FtsH